MAFTREMAAAAPRLRLVQVPGAGLDRIDRAALAPGTALANAYGHDVGIAEYVIGAMLAVEPRLLSDRRRSAPGPVGQRWSGAPVPLWPELAGKSLGILGYGRIGQAVARRALAFDMEVLAIRRDASRPDPHRLAFLRGPGALDEVLERADYLAVTLALTPETRGLIGARELARLKPTAVLDQRGARRGRGRGRALRRASSRRDRGGRARRLVPVPDRRRADPSRPSPVPRAAQRVDDAPRVGLDGRDDGRPGRGHRREHRSRRARRAAAAPGDPRAPSAPLASWGAKA